MLLWPLLFLVAAVKLLSVNKLESGVARLRVSLVKMLKLEIEGVSGERRNKFWIDVQCPDCTPALTKRSKYILAGSDLEALGGQINPDDYIQVYTKSLQKIWKKEIKRCQRKFRKGWTILEFFVGKEEQNICARLIFAASRAKVNTEKLLNLLLINNKKTFNYRYVR